MCTLLFNIYCFYAKECVKKQNKVSKQENAFRTFVEQKVENAQIGDETVLLRIHLIVWARTECGICQRMFRADGIAEIVGADIFGLQVFVGEFYGRADVEKRADGMGYLEVEIEQKLPAALEERTYVVGIIVEERTFSIG